jgi:membrane-bound metal-dependent hydrolase YbcI (DUF457 family)
MGGSPPIGCLTRDKDQTVTLFEHALIGIDGTLALGLQRRHGWQIVALAGIAAALPDLDGLSILFGLGAYAEGHRVWGHNLLVTGLAAAIMSALAYRANALTRLQQWLGSRWRVFAVHGDRGPGVPADRPPVATAPQRGNELALWLTVGVAAAYSHLLLDVVFSVGKNLPVWGVPLLWPFSAKEWAIPLVPWGDVGATLILATGMFAMLRWPKHTRLIAAGSVLATAAYLAARGLFG